MPRQGEMLRQEEMVVVVGMWCGVCHPLLSSWEEKGGKIANLFFPMLSFSLSLSKAG